MSKNEINKKSVVNRAKFWIISFIFTFIILIALFIIPKIMGAGSCSLTVNFTETNMRGLSMPLKMFRLDNEVYPSTQEGLDALIKNPDSKKYPNYADDAYISEIILDGWKRPFRYNSYNNGKSFELISFGADGKYGGEDEDADITFPPFMERN